jgi:hypothetical protein
MTTSLQHSVPNPVQRNLAFLAMLPAIQRHFEITFRHLRRQEREEATQEAIANACVAFIGLVQQGRSHLAIASALARFAVARVYDGREVASRLNARDVLSPYAQRKKRVVVERLDRYNVSRGEWVEAVVEDTRTPVPEQVWFRVDFPEWLQTLLPRDRRVALALAAGRTTGDVAKKFRISCARVSQLRRELHDSWQAFHGELSGADERGSLETRRSIEQQHQLAVA